MVGETGDSGRASFALGMREGAHTPEELETLFEDAFVTRDRDALAALFEDGAVLVSDDRVPEARGTREITHLATAMWERDRMYLADPRRVFQVRDTGLVVARRGISVVRRGRDGAWRYAIFLLSFDHPTQEEQQ